jgi:hypothetical protein
MAERGGQTPDSTTLTASMCRIGDWRRLATLMRLCFPELLEAQVSYQVRTKAWTSCLLHSNGLPVAYWMHSSRKGPKIAWFEQLGVHPDKRKQGLGIRACKHYLQFASWIGFAEVRGSVLKTNRGSLAVFDSMGFVPHPDATEDRVLMVKELDPALAAGWTPPRNFPGRGGTDQKVLERFLYPSEPSRLEDLLKRGAYALFAGTGKRNLS